MAEELSEEEYKNYCVKNILKLGNNDKIDILRILKSKKEINLKETNIGIIINLKDIPKDILLLIYNNIKVRIEKNDQ
jgi:hypothetical protein